VNSKYIVMVRQCLIVVIIVMKNVDVAICNILQFFYKLIKI